jgi:hypothetical protein
MLMANAAANTSEQAMMCQKSPGMSDSRPALT